MDFAKQVKASVDIVNIVGEYVRLKKQGVRYSGLCPFHTEKTPSFSVHAAHQFFICFGCGAKGDVFKFVMDMQGVTFYEALKALAEQHGISMPKRAEFADPESKRRAVVVDLHELAAGLCRNLLNSSAGSDARAYLVRRGVAASAVEEFGIGYSDRSGQFLLKRFEQEGVSREDMEASGLIRKNESGRYYDYFRGRLMFPIHSEAGKVIAFGARALAADDEPKYLNSPDTSCYTKKQVLYNLHRAKSSIRKTERAILVEGYMDVIGVYAAGVQEVVASCGTALTNTQVRAVKRHAERIVVNFDPDNAGANAAERSIQMLLEEGLHVRVLTLAGGLDPDEYIKAHGADDYRARAESATGYFYWLADRARAKFDMRTAEGRMEGLRFLMPAIQRVSDKLERAAIANDIASYLGVAQSMVLDQFRKAAGARGDIRENAQPVIPAIEKLLLIGLLDNDELREEILPALAGMPAVEQFATRTIFEAIFRVWESDGKIQYSEVEARLEDKDKALLASALLADEIGEGAVSLDQARACIRTLELAGRKSAQADLRMRIKAAERSGDMTEALRLAGELNRTQQGSAG
jgi:DNA primase